MGHFSSILSARWAYCRAPSRSPLSSRIRPKRFAKRSSFCSSVPVEELSPSRTRSSLPPLNRVTRSMHALAPDRKLATARACELVADKGRLPESDIDIAFVVCRLRIIGLGIRTLLQFTNLLPHLRRRGKGCRLVGLLHRVESLLQNELRVGLLLRKQFLIAALRPVRKVPRFVQRSC